MIDAIYPVIKAFWHEEKVPKAWNAGLISSVWKGKGDRESMHFQRGITVSSTIAMIPEEIINKRMIDMISLTQSQGGGKKGSSTRDHVFILRSVITIAMKQKRDLYVTFYDVQKAYDHADPEDMMHVAWTHGLNGKIWRLTKSLNTNLTARIKTRHGITRKIKREIGGKQGGKTMTFLFAKMMDVLAEEMDENHEMGINVANIKIGSLLWVDDVITFAEGEEQQNKTLHKTDEFATKHKLEWGQSKCGVMKIGQRNALRKEWDLGEKKIAVVDSYRYLGDIIMRNGGNQRNIEERSAKVKISTRKVITCAKNEVMKKIQVGTLLQLHEVMTVPALLMNSETWILNKTERQKLDCIEIWALKNLLGLPKTTPTAGVMFECGTLFTSIRIDERQFLYLHKVLQRPETDWCRKIMVDLEHENLGWAKQINTKLDEYELTTSWEEIKGKSGEQWKKQVKQAVELKNTQKISEHCHSKKGERSKTKSLIGNIESDNFLRQMNKNMMGMTKIKVKALIMGRYGMLDCGGNYQIKYKTKNCIVCHKLDNESHRINECVLWEKINLYSSNVKIEYEAIYSNDPETMNVLAMTILDLWDIENGRNCMKSE
jgi:predicted nucleic acid-binding protein